MLNKFQKQIIAIGIVAIILTGLVPPWVCSYKESGVLGDAVQRYWGRDFFLRPPSVSYNLQKLFMFFSLPGHRYLPEAASLFDFQIDYMRLLFEWLFIVLVVFGIVLLLNHPKN